MCDSPQILRQIPTELGVAKYYFATPNFISALASTRIDLPMRVQTTARYAGGIKA